MARALTEGRGDGSLATNIDTLAVIGRFEQELNRGAAPRRRDFLLAILDRWQADPDLSEPSRRRAREVVLRFARD